MQFVSYGDNLQEKSSLFPGKNKIFFFKMSSALVLPNMLSVKKLCEIIDKGQRGLLYQLIYVLFLDDHPYAWYIFMKQLRFRGSKFCSRGRIK